MLAAISRQALSVISVTFSDRLNAKAGVDRIESARREFGIEGSFGEIGENWLSQINPFLQPFLRCQDLSPRRRLLEHSDARLADHVVDNFLQIAGFLEHLQLPVGAGAHL